MRAAGSGVAVLSRDSTAKPASASTSAVTAVQRFHGGVKTGWTSSPKASPRTAAPRVMSAAWASYDRAGPNSHLRPAGS